MEEEKAAAYYDELSHKGSGAARFKQGLEISSSFSAGDGNHSDAIPARVSAIPCSSSFLSSFVKASGPSSSSDVAQKQVQIESIQNKLKKKLSSYSSSRVSHRSDRDYRDRDRNSRDGDRYYRDRDRGRRERSRSESPWRYWSSEKKRDDDYDDRKSKTDKIGGVDYVKLIQGYDKMSPAERVKAKMKLHLSATRKIMLNDDGCFNELAILQCVDFILLISGCIM